jgi:hypothetical protein
MVKRKERPSDGLPTSIEVQAAPSGAVPPPFAVYFPSGFEPTSNEAACEWRTYSHVGRKNQYMLVAKTVSVKDGGVRHSRIHIS